MNQYRRKMDELRAPDSLRNQTLQAIQQAQMEEQEDEPQKHPKRIWMPLVSLGAAACLVIAIGLAGGRTAPVDLVYHTVPATVVRTLPQDVQSSLTVEEYGAYLGVDVSSLIDDAELIKSEIMAEYEGETIQGEEGTFYFNVQGKPVMLCLSKTKAVAPESLEGKTVSEIGQWDVVAAVSEDGTERMAAFDLEGIHCFLLARQMEQQDFEQLLQCILETPDQRK